VDNPSRSASFALPVSEDHSARAEPGETSPAMETRADSGLATDQEPLTQTTLAAEVGSRSTNENSPAEGGPAKAGEGERIPLPAQIVRLVSALGWKLFHNANSEGFATLRVADHLETFRLRDAAFKSRLGRLLYKSTGAVASLENLGAALNLLDAQALFDGPEKAVNVRVAQTQGAIYLDLGDAEWRTVQITPSGWQVTPLSPVTFWRTRGTIALPTPVRGGSLADLRLFLNLRSEEDFLLILGWLVAAFRPVGPFPILVIEGNQGAAKTTGGKLLRSLIDPNTTPMRSLPRSERDLMIAAKNSWCQAFENVSAVPDWLSDCLCRLSTGGGFSIRRNYTDDEEQLFNASRPVMLNGIHVGLTRPDALDRSLVITVGDIQDGNYREEAEFWAEFNELKPRILGAVLDAVACAMRRLPEVKIPRPPRMADFARWATAAEPAFGCPGGAFLRSYQANRQEANELALEGSVLVGPVKAIAEAGAWSGTASELLSRLQSEPGVDRRHHDWPKTPAKLAGQLRRLISPLRSSGITVQLEQTAGANSRKIISIGRRP